MLTRALVQVGEIHRAKRQRSVNFAPCRTLRITINQLVGTSRTISTDECCEPQLLQFYAVFARGSITVNLGLSI
jgi:hypothetical protein